MCVSVCMLPDSSVFLLLWFYLLLCSRASPGREKAPELIPHIGPRFAAKGRLEQINWLISYNSNTQFTWAVDNSVCLDDSYVS